MAEVDFTALPWELQVQRIRADPAQGNRSYRTRFTDPAFAAANSPVVRLDPVLHIHANPVAFEISAANVTLV